MGKNLVQTLHTFYVRDFCALPHECIDCGKFSTHFPKMQDQSCDNQQPDVHLSSSSTVLTTMSPKDAKTGLKWNSHCKAHKVLSDGLTNGTIDPSQKPKEVWESHTEFQKYPLHSFRSAFNRKKAELGCNLRAEGKYPSSQSFSFFFFGFFHPLFFIFCFLFSSHSRSFLT